MLDFPVVVVRLKYKGQSEVLSMLPECMRPRKMGGATDSEEFISSSESDQVLEGFQQENYTEAQEVGFDRENRRGEMKKVCFGKGRAIKEGELGEKLSQLNEKLFKEVKSVLQSTDVDAASL